MNLPLPSETVFYSIEKAIKSYRKFSQKNISDIVDDITIDQALVLLFLDKYPDLTQKEIAELVFKDNASMTRMIDLMVKKKYLKRSINAEDRRRFKLKITTEGSAILVKLPPIVLNNRTESLQGITKAELVQLDVLLKKIIANCEKNNAHELPI